MKENGLPPPQGLYDPRREHAACGVGFVANMAGRKSRQIIAHGLEILKNLSHRGAVAADPLAGDGAGLLLQLPRRFFADQVRFPLPPPGDYAVGMIFMPRDRNSCNAAKAIVEQCISDAGQRVLGWRAVPVNNDHLSVGVRATEPAIRQVFIARAAPCAAQAAFERKLFVIRQQIENRVRAAARRNELRRGADFYIASLSSTVITYKGMLLAAQLSEYYPDLLHPRMESAMALVHQRFSTNTFPTWSLAHPYRMIAHNGEINTLRGNLNWMAARRNTMSSALLGEDLHKVWPLIAEGQSDSAAFDNTLALLLAGGYSLAHAMLLLVPQAWAENPLLSDAQRAFYEYHAALMEPWDGPAAVVFTDGKQIGAMLDRNGLRPARYLVTNDGLVVMASEMGVLAIPEANIIKKWRLQPGKMLLLDLEQGRMIDDDEIKNELASAHDYQRWLDNNRLELSVLRAAKRAPPPAADPQTLLKLQQAFGYTQEDLKFLLLPMLADGAEAIGSMGADVPLPVLSARSKPLASYFKQNFAQVTNPPIDPLREQLVMSLLSHIGPRPNLFDHDPQHGAQRMRLTAAQPILSDQQLESIRHLETHPRGAFKVSVLNICFPVGDTRMQDALEKLCARAEQTVLQPGEHILILSDRRMDAEHMAIPALLATSAVHHHLINKGLRTETGLVVETGACLEVHQAATLAGYGAEAINPYLAFATIQTLLPQLQPNPGWAAAQDRYIAALGAGLKKVMSKMGISTYQSYCGAQIFDAVGLSTKFVDQYFCGTATAVEGAGLAQIAAETRRWHRQAYGEQPLYRQQLDAGGDYAYRLRGEAHIWNPDTIHKLQQATRTNQATTFAEFADAVDHPHDSPFTLRGLFEFANPNSDRGAPLPIEQVEAAADIVKRFSTGAMSFGSISYEAHANLAKAMNRLGGKSNTGEGGEEAARYRPLADGSLNLERSAIKQVASGRFGVTAEYLVNADDLQIKMAQGAKPGEGGQIPGHKVNQQIAKVRHSTPGVGLISPPPHHDIYSIEDLAQLIYDLKNVNPRARISVKLVSEIGVGTVAAGVAKAHADQVTISGHEGGTGASPLTSIRHAGSPWEIGLAETHQTLVLNKLRGRIAVQVDGGLRTGRDVAIGALLGADEFGFATAPLIVSGCLMMRKCHLNTCPVGVATQDPQLRAKFTGQPEHVINYFFLVAEQVRQIMAQLGYRKLQQMIGQMQHLDMRKALRHWKAAGLDYSRLLTKIEVGPEVALYQCEPQRHGLEQALDHQLLKQAAPALQHRKKVRIDIAIRNIHRAFGSMLSGRIAQQYGHAGLPPDTIHIRARGTAGQSLGAWLAHGVTIELAGEGNDYVGKGLCGGRLIIYPPRDSGLHDARQNIIVGNTVLYGATAGQGFFNGAAGERFGVRNSGAVAVVEGVGDHGCEYMTGGVVVCLGPSGRNFAAGMSGGIAYVLDAHGEFATRCNQQTVTLQKITPQTTAEAATEAATEATTEAEIAADANADDLFADLSGDDERRLKWLLQQHRRYTNSRIADAILKQWRDYLGQFVKVMPIDYQRALRRLRRQQPDQAPVVTSSPHEAPHG